eukprot:TRINITY_DN67504_c0_g1_i1.p1 TRINITY_DN67504_c0_g1~~TRINITY_DN67504_c0_g1_i1.p1  ORF type:complete len:1092 (+),score=212.91 TRINITY_DN67504_c0_g1_i1:122-3397(+)
MVASRGRFVPLPQHDVPELAPQPPVLSRQKTALTASPSNHVGATSLGRSASGHQERGLHDSSGGDNVATVKLAARSGEEKNRRIGGGEGGGRRGNISDAPSPGIDVGRLLAGLQRGIVPGADNSVAFLCQKFTLLGERLQRAEVDERENEERRVLLEADLCTEEATLAAERTELEAAAAAVREESRALASSLSETQQEELRTEECLEKIRAEKETLSQRRRALDQQCANDRARVAEANSRIRQLHVSRPSGRDELRRLQGRLDSLGAQCTAAAVELQECRERASRDETRVSELRAEVQSEEQSQSHVNELASSQREELTEALSELAELKEELTGVQVSSQCCEEELGRHSEHKRAIWSELQRREAWIANAARQADGLPSIERGLEKVLADTAEARSQLNVETTEEQLAESTTRVREAALADTQTRSNERAQRLEEAEHEHAAIRSEVNVAEDEHRALEASVEQLRHEQVANGGIRQNLESEMRLLLAEAEQLRIQRDERAANRLEIQQRLSLVNPALQDAKRRVRDLEERLGVVRATCSQEQQVNERLEREASTCQDKMLALRDQNVRLSEMCTEFEAQLAHTSAQRVRPNGSVQKRPGSASRVGAVNSSATVATGGQRQQSNGSLRRASSGGPLLGSTSIASSGANLASSSVKSSQRSLRCMRYSGGRAAACGGDSDDDDLPRTGSPSPSRPSTALVPAVTSAPRTPCRPTPQGRLPPTWVDDSPAVEPLPMLGGTGRGSVGAGNESLQSVALPPPSSCARSTVQPSCGSGVAARRCFRGPTALSLEDGRCEDEADVHEEHHRLAAEGRHHDRSSPNGRRYGGGDAEDIDFDGDSFRCLDSSSKSDLIPHLLQVSIVRAHGLKHLNYVGDAPWCRCEVKRAAGHCHISDYSMNKRTKFETAALPKTLDPEWNETHEIEPWFVGDSLEFTIFDKGVFGSRTEGRVVVPSHRFHPHAFEGELPIDGLDHATLYVRIIPVCLQAHHQCCRGSDGGVGGFSSSSEAVAAAASEAAAGGAASAASLTYSSQATQVPAATTSASRTAWCSNVCTKSGREHSDTQPPSDANHLRYLEEWIENEQVRRLGDDTPHSAR